MKRKLLIATALMLLCTTAVAAQSSVRTVTGTLRKIDRSPWAGAKVIFRLEKSTYTGTDQFPPSEITSTTDTNGQFTVSLWTNAEGLKPVQYRYVEPGGSSFFFTLPPGDPINISTIRAGASVEPTVTNQVVLQSVVDAHNASASAHDADKATAVNLGLMKCGAGLTCGADGTVTTVVGASDHGALTGLADDDHLQYLTNARGDARYAQLGHSHDSLYFTEAETTALLAGKANTAHLHVRADITDFAHTHAVADTTGLQATLDAKAAAAHTHGLAQITDEGALAAKNTVATADIDADAVTFPKLQNIATNKLLGRSTAGSGDVEEISVGSNLTLSGGTLSAAGGSPGGLNKQVQFNNGGSFGGAAGFEYQSGTSPNVLLQAQAASHVALEIRRAASPSAAALKVYESNGSTQIFEVGRGGLDRVEGRFYDRNGTDQFAIAAHAEFANPFKLVWKSVANWYSGTQDLAIGRTKEGVLGLGNDSSETTGTTFRAKARTAAQITADQNNYVPGGFSLNQRWSSDASRTVTGLSLAQVDGEHHYVWNVGSQNIVLANENASSTAANRFTTSTGGDLTLAPNKCALLIYDGTTSRWRAVLLP